MAKFSIRKQLFNDRFVLVLSIIVALAIWLFVSISLSPISTKDISNVPVTIPLDDSTMEGLEAFGVENESFSVQVKISGKKYITDSVSADDIAVTANVGQIAGTGVNTLELSAKPVNSDEEFEVISVSPSRIVVYLDYPESKTLDASVEYRGATVSKDNYFLEASVPENNRQVVITGAKNEVQKISKAVITAEVNSTLSETASFPGKVILYDALGNEVSLEYSNLSFYEANVTVSVQELADLPVTFTAVNGPEKLPKYDIYRIVNGGRTAAGEITVKGEPSVVETLKDINLGNIDFSALDMSAAKWSFSFSLPSIGGITYPTISSSSDAQFEVVIDKSGIVSKSFDLGRDQMKIIGLRDGATADLQTDSLQGITVVSTSSYQLNRLKSPYIMAYIDVSSLEVGSHSCDRITFTITGYPDCWVVKNAKDSVAAAVKING